MRELSTVFLAFSLLLVGASSCKKTATGPRACTADSDCVISCESRTSCCNHPYCVRDMAGGVREWVGDVHGEQTELEGEDEPAPSTERGDAGKRRVRSGNPASDHKWCRAASRSSFSALMRGAGLGFRVAKTLTPKQR